MKIVINCCHGGFGLSSAGVEYYYRLKGIQEFFYYAPFWDSETKKLNQYKRVASNTNQEQLCLFTKDFGSDGIIEISEEDFDQYCLSDFEIERTDGCLIKTSEEDFDQYCLSDFEIERTNGCLIKTVEDLGEKANDEFSDLEIVEIPDDVQW